MLTYKNQQGFSQHHKAELQETYNQVILKSISLKCEENTTYVIHNLFLRTKSTIALGLQKILRQISYVWQMTNVLFFEICLGLVR